MIKKNFIPGLIVLSFFFSCSKKDIIPDETCYDTIKNQNELQPDCGGVCRPCPEGMTAKINGNPWVADTSSISSSFSNVGSKFLMGGRILVSPYSQISLVYLGAFSLGSHELDHSSSCTPDFNGSVTFATSGTITISEMDTRNYLISGSFSFTSSDGTSTFTITEGTFTNVKYTLN
ncbi:MAG: DUF6252 family protein [Bacteroidia bacterium]